MTVVDSSVWVDYFNGVRTRATDRLDSTLGSEPVVVGDLILAELLQGFRSESDARTALHLLSSLEFQEMVGRRVAIAGAANYRTLRSRGVTVRKTVDVLIGTFCLLHGHSLLHSDRDFEPMVTHLGLKTVPLS